jgi:hypothetical protein
VSKVSRRRRRRGAERSRPLPSLGGGDEVEASGWIEYCGGSMFVVGYTEGGAPYGYVNWSHESSVLDSDSGEFADDNALFGS